MDNEVAAMAAISDAVEKLDSDARRRVLQWAAGKYAVPNTLMASRPLEPTLVEPAGTNTDPGVLERHGNGYESFAELYAAAKPIKDAEKVLVAAYWHQVLAGQKELTSAVLNKDLANLGHRIVNINMKFDALIAQKPQLAMQLQKLGSTKQARKKYKLTQAGIARVQGMLSGGMS